jgi:hypothetical protein
MVGHCASIITSDRRGKPGVTDNWDGMINDQLRITKEIPNPNGENANSER